MTELQSCHSTQILEAKLSELAQLRDDISEIKGRFGPLQGALDQIAEALTRLAVMEERQSAFATMTNKNVENLEKTQERVNDLEHQMIRIDTAAVVVKRVLVVTWVVLGTAILSFAGNLVHVVTHLAK